MAKRAMTVAEQIMDLIPKSIDDIIRLNRDKASLRFVTLEDLEPLASEIPPSVRAVPISIWNLVTLTMHGDIPERHVLLLGRNDNENCTWCTSPVQCLDAKAGLLVTRSGTIYSLAGERATEEDLDLMHLCVYLRKSGAGDAFGIPAFFY